MHITNRYIQCTATPGNEQPANHTFQCQGPCTSDIILSNVDDMSCEDNMREFVAVFSACATHGQQSYSSAHSITTSKACVQWCSQDFISGILFRGFYFGDFISGILFWGGHTVMKRLTYIYLALVTSSYFIKTANIKW